MIDAIFISDDLVASKSSITQKYTIWNTNTLQYDYNYKTQCIWRSNQIELAWEYSFKNTTTIWLQIQNSCISKSNQIESAWKYIHWALIVDEQWTPPIAMAQQTNKKTLHNIQEFSSIPFIKSSLEFFLFFLNGFEISCQLNSLGIIFHLKSTSSFELRLFEIVYMK